MNMSERNYQWDLLQAKGCVVAEGSLQAQAIVCSGLMEGSLQVQGIVCSGGLVASSRVVVCTMNGCCFSKLEF